MPWANFIRSLPSTRKPAAVVQAGELIGNREVRKFQLHLILRKPAAKDTRPAFFRFRRRFLFVFFAHHRPRRHRAGSGCAACSGSNQHGHVRRRFPGPFFKFAESFRVGITGTQEKGVAALSFPRKSVFSSLFSILTNLQSKEPPSLNWLSCKKTRIFAAVLK